MPYKNKELGRLKKREYYQANKDKRKLYDAVPENSSRRKHLDSKRRVQRKQLAVEALGGRCSDCKQQFHLACYDFHHLDPSQKDFNPCSGLTKKKETFLAELAKCVLLCANCHRLRHFKYDTEFS